MRGPPRNPMRRGEHLLAVAVLAALAYALFAPALSQERTWSLVADHETVVWPWRGDVASGPFADTYPQSDQADSFYPWSVLTTRALEAGELPLWNPYSFAGAPFFTNGQNAALYPPNTLLALALDDSWQHDLYLLLHLFASGLAMYALARSLGLKLAAALLGAVAWQFAPFAMGWLQFGHIGVTATFLPLALMFSRRATLGRSTPAAVGCGASLGLMILGGNLSYSAFAGVIVAAYAAALTAPMLTRALRERRRREAAGQLARVALIGGVALGLAACMLLPTWLAFRGVARVPYSAGEQAATALGWGGLADIVRRPGAGSDVLASPYVGAAVAVLAGIGVLTRRPGTGLGRTCALVFGALIFGGIGISIARLLLPGFGFTPSPVRLIPFFGFGVALLAAVGLQTVLDRLEGRARAGPLLAAALAVAAISYTAWQLMDNALDVNPPAQPRESSYLFGDTRTLQAVRHEGPGLAAGERLRIAPIRTGTLAAPQPPTMYASHAIVPGIESAAGYESLLDERSVNLWRVVTGESAADVLGSAERPGYFLTNFFAGTTRFDLLPRVGVTTLLAPPDLDADAGWKAVADRVRARRTFTGPGGIVLDLLDPTPRALVVGEHEVAPGDDALVRYTDPAFPFRERVLLDRDPGVPSRAVDGEVTDVRASLDEVWVDVQSSGPGWLVLLDTFDPGWQATVNGHDAHVERANYDFRAVRVPAGRSRVHMVYRPPGLTAGLAVSGLTLLALAAFGLTALVRRRAARA